MLVEGRRLVGEAIQAGVRPALVLWSARFGSTPEGAALLVELHQHSVPTAEISEGLMRQLCDTVTPQGILAATEIPRVPWPDSPSLLVVADDVRDPGNLGTILRSAWAAGASGAVLLPGTADHTNPKVARAAAGAHFRLPIASSSVTHAAELLQGMEVWLASASRGTPYSRVDWRQRCAIVIGGEAEGASAGGQGLATGNVLIPMPGEAESLNAAVAAAILLFEAVRQRSDHPATGV